MFNTKSNYNSKGNEQDLLTNRSYKLMSGRVWGAFDWDERLRAYVSTGYAQATSSNGFSTGEQTGSGMTDVEVKAYWEAGFRPWFFRPFGRFVYPMQRVSLGTRTPIYAEGAMEVEAGGRMGYDWNGITPYAQVSLRYMDEGRATLLPWSLGAQVKYNFLLAGLELYGQEVLKKDSKSDDPRDKQFVTDFSNGGSYKFYAVDPSYYEVRAYVGADVLNQLILRLGYGQTLLGKNAAAGQTILLSLEYRFGEEKSDPRYDRFEAPPESYDQKLFQEEVTPNTKRKRSNALDKEFDGIQEQPPTATKPVPVPQPRPRPAPVQQPSRVQQPQSSDALEKEFETMRPTKPRPTKKQIKQKQMLDDVERELERKK